MVQENLIRNDQHPCIQVNLLALKDKLYHLDENQTSVIKTSWHCNKMDYTVKYQKQKKGTIT